MSSVAALKSKFGSSGAPPAAAQPSAPARQAPAAPAPAAVPAAVAPVVAASPAPVAPSGPLVSSVCYSLIRIFLDHRGRSLLFPVALPFLAPDTSAIGPLAASEVPASVVKCSLNSSFHDIIPALSAKLQIRGVSSMFLLGCPVSPSDSILAILRNGDRLTIQDSQDYIKANFEKTDGFWLSCIREDAIDKAIKGAKIGFNKNTSEFWAWGGAKQPGEREFDLFDLKMFSFTEMRAFQSPTVLLDYSESGGSSFYKLEYLPAENAMKLALKTGSDDQAMIQKLPIEWNDRKSLISPLKDKVQIVQNALMSLEGVAYDLKRQSDQSGPVYPDPEENKQFYPRDNEWQDITETPSTKANPIHQVELNHLPFMIKQRAAITCEQTWANSGKFNNRLLVEVDIFSKQDEEITFSSIVGEWKNEQGEWKAFDALYVRNEYNQAQSGSETWIAHGKTSNKIILVADLFCQAPQLDRVHRLHGSFPSPIEMKFRFSNMQNEKQPLVLHARYKNLEPVDVQTTKTAYSRWSSTSQAGGPHVFRWFRVFADDFQAEGRIWATGIVHREVDGTLRWEIQHALNSSTVNYYSTETFRQLAIEAIEEGKSTILLPESSKIDEKLGLAVQIHGFVDKERRQIYGLEISIKTNTGTAKQTVQLFDFEKIPLHQIKE